MKYITFGSNGGTHPDPSRTENTQTILFFNHTWPENTMTADQITKDDGLQIGGVTLDANSQGKLILINGTAGSFLKMNGIWEVYTTTATYPDQIQLYRVADLDYHDSLGPVNEYIAEIRPGSGATHNGASIEGNQYQLQDYGAGQTYAGYSVDNQPFEFTDISS